MKYLKFLIIVGQMGRIWSKSWKARRVYQTLSAIGFFSLLFRKHQKEHNPRRYDNY